MSKETMNFQAEVKQLLQLMIHSLYSNKEIFLRELISNACDAQDKLRLEALKDPSIKSDNTDPIIKVSFDEEAKTITIQDNGIGMSKEELIENLGTIAKSGTKAFLAQLSEQDKQDNNLIGQFGVGFYSSFIVANKVEVTTRRAGDDIAHRWTSEGEGEFDIETAEKSGQGTIIVLHLREDAQDLLNHYRLSAILKRYSDHVSFPIMMKKADSDEWETINQASALWSRNKNDITKEQYEAFYQHLTHDHQTPLAWTHNHVEGRSEYTQLLYIPRHAPMDLWDANMSHGLNLYVKRVFIMNDAEQLLPMYLRFIKGVVDSNDLPLNVSREILQDSQDVRTIREANTKRVLKTLESMAKNEPDNYQLFWNEFGQAFKQGTGEDPHNAEMIASLLRFTSTHTDSATQNVTLADYVERMKEGQTEIYYLIADRYETAKNSPHLEALKAKGIEVLLLTDRIDDWMMTYFRDYQGKPMVNITKDGFDSSHIDGEKTEEEKEQVKAQEEAMQPLITRFETALKGEIKKAQISHRLVDSPACVVSDQNELSPYMLQMLKAAGQEVPESLPTLEINPNHTLIQPLTDMDEASFVEWAKLILDQALLCASLQLKDPNAFVQRMNKLLMK